MQGRNEVEEILEQEAWAARNGLDRPFSALERPGPVYLPPADMLRAHELKSYRDCPIEYAGEEMQKFQSFGWALLAAVIGVAFSAVVSWLWAHA